MSRGKGLNTRNNLQNYLQIIIKIIQNSNKKLILFDCLKLISKS